MKAKPIPEAWWPRVAILLGLGLASCAGASPIPTVEVDPLDVPETYDAKAGLEAFDRAWSRIGETYFDSAMEGLDWDEVRADLRPRAAAATSGEELRAVVSQMIHKLDKSHFEIIGSGAGGGEPVPDGQAWVGFDLRSLDGEMIVTRVDPGTPAAEAGVTPGWVLEEIDGIGCWAGGDSPRERLWAWQRNHARLLGAAGSGIDLRFRDGDDQSREMMLSRVDRPGESIKTLNLPEYYAGVEARRIALPDGGCVAYLQFEIWMLPVLGPFQDALRDMSDCAGVVVDLRGNLGGVGALARGLAGYFVQERGNLGKLITRDNTLDFSVQPRPLDPKQGKGNYAGPLAILTDSITASTSEIFAAGLQEMGRARTFGETSAGMALPAVTEELPSGDILLHAVADFTTPKGVPIEGRGVTPDVPVALTRAALLRGNDAVLDAAVRWIGTLVSEGSSR